MSLPRPEKFHSLLLRTSFILLFFILITTTILFENQLSKAQDSISQFLEKANSLYDQGKYQEAITWYDKALAIDPNDVDALNGKTQALSGNIL